MLRVAGWTGMASVLPLAGCAGTDALAWLGGALLGVFALLFVATVWLVFWLRRGVRRAAEDRRRMAERNASSDEDHDESDRPTGRHSE